MASYKISGDFCYICRNERYANKIVPCEESGICKPITQLPPDDEEYPMWSTPDNEFVINGWVEITSISKREKYEISKKSGDKTELIALYLPTLEKLEIWMALQDWDTAPIDQQEFFRRIMIFHNKYVEIISQV